MADAVPVALALLEQPFLAQPLDDVVAGLVLGQPDQLVRDVAGHATVEADHRQLGQPVVAPDLEVDRIVPRRDLQRPGPELRLDALVRDHRHAPADHRHDHLLADVRRVALVAGMHRDGDVGEDRRRPHGRDRDVTVAVSEEIPRVRQRVVDLDVLDLEIGDRRAAVRAPVDDPVVAVDEAALVEVDEEAHHGADVVVVHREALAVVVERAAEPPELAHDHAAVLVQPLPDALDERVASDLLSRRSAAPQVFLDDRLRRDPRVVVPRLPERVEAAHPVPARERVLDRRRSARVPCAARRSRSAAAPRSRSSASSRTRRRGRGPPPPTRAASVLRHPSACRAAPSPSGADPSQQSGELKQRLCAEYAETARPRAGRRARRARRSGRRRRAAAPSPRREPSAEARGAAAACTRAGAGSPRPVDHRVPAALRGLRDPAPRRAGADR